MACFQVLCLVLGLLSAATLSQGCDRTLSVEEKSFTLPNSDYVDNMDCTYTLRGDGRDIKLGFEYFEVEGHSSCDYDYLEIINREGTSTGRICGQGNPGEIISTSFTVKFHTDGSMNDYMGFKMTFEYYDPVGDCTKIGGECSRTCGEGKEPIDTCSSSQQCCVNNPLPSACGEVPAKAAGSYRSGSRIVDGTDALPHNWPWQVSLQYTSNNFHFCGGSLISDRWVVTAAHCVDGQDINDIKVRVGEHHTGNHDSGNNLETTGEDVAMENFFKHEQYDDGTATYANDIALVKLARDVTYDDRIQPACVPEVGATFGNSSHKCWITGWGDDKDDSSKGEYVLQELEVHAITNELCGQKWGRSSINDGHVCVFDARDDVTIGGACNGDSGGPLACQIKNDGSAPFWLAGATSWGVGGCTTSDYPAVYSRVSKFRDWIIKKMVTE